MGDYLKLFETDTERVSYEDSENYIEPYVSYVDGDNSVHYNKPKETRLVATYNVEDASEPTQLYGYGEEGLSDYWIKGVDVFSKVEIDGTEVAVADLDTAQGEYQFSAGEHTVKYTLIDPTSINDGAFYQCYSLASINIPNSVTSIGESAFYYCEGLTSASIGSGVISIGPMAFNSCFSLRSVTIPNSVTSIGDNAFQGCDLASVNIPDSVTSIGDFAFQGCDSLTSVNISNSVTSIGEMAFSLCGSLTSISVDSNNAVYDSRSNCNAIIETATNTLISGCKNTIIPNSVTSIGEGAFSGCRGLTSVIIPDSVTSIGDGAFSSCSGLASITIPSGVTNIGYDTFGGCDSLTSVNIPNSVTSIGESAFYGCDSLTSVNIPNSVTSISERAFQNCGLTSVTIGNGVTSIGDLVFNGCYSLTSVTIEATTPPTLDIDAFNNSNNCPIYVPSQSVETYKAASGWSTYASRIQAIPTE